MFNRRKFFKTAWGAVLAPKDVKPPQAFRYASIVDPIPRALHPMICRTYPELVAAKIVGIRPTGSAISDVFNCDYEYDVESNSWRPRKK